MKFQYLTSTWCLNLIQEIHLFSLQVFFHFSPPNLVHIADVGWRPFEHQCSYLPISKYSKFGHRTLGALLQSSAVRPFTSLTERNIF